MKVAPEEYIKMRLVATQTEIDAARKAATPLPILRDLLKQRLKLATIYRDDGARATARFLMEVEVIMLQAAYNLEIIRAEWAKQAL